MLKKESVDLISYLAGKKAIVLDVAISKTKAANSYWELFGYLYSKERVNIILAFEDDLSPAFFSEAEKHLPASSFKRRPFLETLKEYAKKDCAFVFAPGVSKFKISVFAHYRNMVGADCDVLFADESGRQGSFLTIIDGVRMTLGIPKVFEGAREERSEPEKPQKPKEKKETKALFTLFTPDKKPPEKEAVVLPEYARLFKDTNGSGLLNQSDVFTTRKGDKIILRDNIGKDGGESVVYTAEFGKAKSAPMIAKMYRPGSLTKNKQRIIERMLEKPVDQQGVAWPLDAVLFEGEIVGYVRKDAGNSNLHNYLSSLELKKNPKRDSVIAAIKVCEIVARVHKLGLVIGDLKPENFLIYRDPSGAHDLNTMAVIDSDSFQIDEFPTSMITPPFASPILFGLQNYLKSDIVYVPQEVDCFALAVLLLQILVGFASVPYLLSEGDDPDTYLAKYRAMSKDCLGKDKFLFSNVSKEQTSLGIRNPFQQACWTHLPSPIKDAFCCCFNKVGKKLGLSAEQWIQLLTKYSEELANGSLLSIDPDCNVMRFTNINQAEKAASFPYEKLKVNWGFAFLSGSRRAVSSRTKAELERFKSVFCSADGLGSLLNALCEKSGFVFKNDERERALASLNESATAEVDVFDIHLVVNIGIAVSGKIARCSE